MYWCQSLAFNACRSPHGERELKSHDCVRPGRDARRSPHGERELKCSSVHYFDIIN